MASTYGTQIVIKTALEAIGPKPTTAFDREHKRHLTTALRKCEPGNIEEFTEDELNAIADAKAGLIDVLEDSIPYDWWTRSQRLRRR